MHKVLITDPVSEQGIQSLLEAPDVEVVKAPGIAPDELLERIGEFDALIVRSQTQVTAEVIERGKRLKVIGRAGVGVDNIDVDAATKAGVVVINAPDGNTISTAEHTFAMLLAVARKIPQAYKRLTEGVWDRKSFQGVELNGKTLGIIGLGRIGTEVAKRAKAFHMNVLAYDPYLTEDRAKKLGVTHCSFEDVIRQADFITVHTPLMKETYHLIGRREFELMKDGVRILNCARGGIIDEGALYEALVTGKVAGAALDVFEEEPVTDHPLFKLPQVVVTPHLGASTVEAQENVAIDVSIEVLHVLRGEPFRNAVNLPSVPGHVLERLKPYFQLGEKLGHFVAQITEGAPREIAITYSGQLADLETQPLTRTILKGFLSYRLGHGVNDVNAPHLAKLREIRVVEQKSSANEGFTDLISLTVKTDQQERYVAGTRFHGYGARIVKIDEYSIDAEPQGTILFVHHNDRPGVIGTVGTILGNHEINIATMQVGRKGVGGDAIMMIQVDRTVPEEVLDLLKSSRMIHSIKQIVL